MNWKGLTLASSFVLWVECQPEKGSRGCDPAASAGLAPSTTIFRHLPARFTCSFVLHYQPPSRISRQKTVDMSKKLVCNINWFGGTPWHKIGFKT
jgi:hypothetical protein